MQSIIPKKIQLLLLSLLLLIAGSLHAKVYVTGTHYKEISPKQSITIKSQPEVIEFFYYGCPHCNNALPHVERWLKTKPASIKFSRVSAFFSKRWQWSAYLYAVATSLGVAEKIHTTVFDKQFNRGGIKSRKDIYDIFATVNITEEQVNKAYESFAVKNMVEQASKLSERSGITGTPSFMVKGKYLVSPRQAGTFEEMIKIINYLLKKG